MRGFDLTAAAVRAELAQTPEPFVEPGPVREAIAALMSRRAPAEAQQLQRGLAKLRDLDAAEACRVGRAIYDEVPVLGAPHDHARAFSREAVIALDAGCAADTRRDAQLKSTKCRVTSPLFRLPAARVLIDPGASRPIRHVALRPDHS